MFSNGPFPVRNGGILALAHRDESRHCGMNRSKHYLYRDGYRIYKQENVSMLVKIE